MPTLSPGADKRLRLASEPLGAPAEQTDCPRYTRDRIYPLPPVPRIQSLGSGIALAPMPIMYSPD